MIKSSLRKFILASHITFSIGWFGAGAAFVVLNVVALTEKNFQTVRSSYIAMDLIGWYVILPTSCGSLITGLIQSFGTSWGLFKYYWVSVKFILTVGSTFLLLLHMQLISQGSRIAAQVPLQGEELQGIGMNLLTRSVAAFIVLLAAIIISVYKPWGKIQFKQYNNIQHTIMTEKKSNKKWWGLYSIMGLIIFIVILIIKHLLSGGVSRHSH